MKKNIPAFEKLKNKIKENKKVAIIATIGICALILLVGASIYSMKNDKPIGKSSTYTSAKAKAKTDSESDKKKDVSGTTKSESTTASGEKSAASKGKHSGSSSKTRVWVVDRAAWTETISHQSTVTKYKCGSKIFDDYDSGYAYYGSDEHIAEGGGSLYPIDVPVTTYETVQHPEQGHWEYR